MALLIQKSINVLGEIPITNIYVRLYVTLGFDGKSLSINTMKYTSKAAYKSGINTNNFIVQSIPEHLDVPYNRTTDGTDVLSVSHTKLQSYLSTEQTSQVPVLDVNGHLQYDTNNVLITTTVITIPKFAELSQITFVDL
jgi:hypothetical protein